MAAFLAAAALLSLERIAYVWVWRQPDGFRTACHRLAPRSPDGPVTVLRRLFYTFKGVQVAVFAGWCYVYGGGTLWPSAEGPWLALGLSLICGGQLLNWSVFRRLGDAGVFYGNRFGYDVPWSTAFPFSVLDHPQYVGAVMSIWGLFLIARFPNPDWYVLPAVETVYYVVGSYLER